MTEAASATASLHVFLNGRVQGVGFRATTLDEPRRRSLAGWVRNRSDGDVEVWAEGPRAVLEDFLAFLRQGPRMAHVTHVAAEWGDPEGAPFPFEMRKTS